MLQVYAGSVKASNQLKSALHGVTHFFSTPFIGDRQYEPLGCYADNVKNRTLPILIKNLRGGIHWKDMSKTIAKCAKETAAKDPKLKVFALQFYGECFSGYNGLQTYKKYGARRYSDKKTKFCWAGVGRQGMNFVYKFKD